MHNDEITVVCPTYNSSHYIDRAIQSILSQKDPPSEVVFSDDGSKDETVSIIEKNRSKFEKLNIDLIILQNIHKGPGFARNQGILSATKAWIAFLDSDDEWMIDKIKNINQVISKKNTETNCILHWESYIRQNGQSVILKHGSNYISTQNISNQLYTRNFFSTSAIVCRKDIIAKCGYFDETLPNGQDYELWLRMSPLIRLTVIPHVLGSYFEEESSITARPYYKRCISNLRIVWQHKDKGSTGLLILKIYRILISKQWYYTFVNLLMGRYRHSG